MAWNTSTKPFSGFSVPSRFATKQKDMDVEMESASSLTAPDNDIVSGRPEGFQEAFETGIEHQKFACALERLQKHRKGTAIDVDISSILPEFDALCSTRADQFENRKDSDVEYLSQGATNEHKLWQSESHTWLLLQTLASAFDRSKPAIEKGPDALAWSDLDLVEHLARTDRDFKHHTAVKLWLEIIAPTVTPRIMKKTYSQQTSIRPSFSFAPKPISTRPEYMDPDATTRDGTKLNENNQRVERDLLKTVWEYIRRGQIQRAKEACVKAGEPWRAESIGGGELYSVSLAFTDPTYDRDEGPIGNKTRGLWKGTCFALANESTADQYERAIYGALCGDVPSVLAVCSSWEDHAWAHYNALVESMVEARLSQFNRGGPSKALSLPTPKITSAEKIFEGLVNSDNQDLRNESKDMFKTIQTSIVLGRTDQLLTKMARDAMASGQTGAPLRPHMMRFLAHLVIYLRLRSDSAVPEDAGNYFIKIYVDYLISKKLYSLAPLYASYLPINLQVETCSSYLKTIDGPTKEREEHLATILKYGLDSHIILTATVDALLDKGREDFERPDDHMANMQQSISTPTTEQEETNIKALEWLSFNSLQYEEHLKRSNHLTRKYLIQGRINVAFALFNALPDDVVQQDLERTTSASLSISNELIYYRDLFNSRVLFEEWKKAIGSKPEEDSPRPKLLAWEVDVKSRAQKAIVEIESLLQSRWLFDCIIPGDVVRNKELRRLRQIYISELVMNLHQVYYESRVVVPGYLEKSVSMSNLVASESSGVPLYKELQESDRLEEFLKQVRLSSIELVKEDRSPFAY
ncbi:nuclear pore protein 84/107 [Dissophora ornata]|nr:nuclear pore protein 84/107 [Dissophora ornata]